MKNRKKLLVVFAILILIIVGAFLIYTNDFYKADKSVYSLLESSNSTEYKDKDLIVFNTNKENDTGKGFIFYPGGKVEYTSYIPILYELSQRGLTTILVKMPLNLAVFNQDAAEKVYDIVPEISKWYIGGHSLGAAMASRYVGNADMQIRGLILLAAFPEEDKIIPTISIYGSQDDVLTQKQVHGSYELIEIPGGNHAYFGDYGEQDGDGKASITRKDQQEITVNAIMDFINRN